MFSIGNMKIGVRLGAAFAVMVALIVTLAGSAIWLMIGTQHRIERITDEISQEVKQVSFAYTRVLREAAALRSVIMLQDLEAKKKVIARMVTYREEFRSSFKATKGLFDKYGATEKEATLIKDIGPGYEEVAKRIDEVSKFALVGQNAEAIKAWDDADKVFRKLQADLETLTETEYKNNDEVVAEAKVAFRTSLEIMGGIVAGAVAFALLVAMLITRSITRPIGEAVVLAKKVADGDLTSRIEVTSKDEIGQLLQALKDMNESLVKIVGEVRSGTEAIGSGTKQIASGNADLSQRTEEQASSLEETASSMEELTSTVKQNAENAKQANQLALGASSVAVKGGTVVSEVVETMSSINESSKKIVDIISVIDGIAFQTNILALNAAVEAARAGEQGRGFAVVASEVRNLAQRSAAAAKEIKALIADSVDKVGAGTKLVDQAGKTMEEIVSSVKRVTDIMSEIAAASQEQSAGIEQVNQAITQMDEVTQQNAALVEEAAAAAESLEEQAQNLAQAVSVFKLANAIEGTATRVVERREVATRPANVARLAPIAVKAKRAMSRTAPAHARTGTDGDWSEF